MKIQRCIRCGSNARTYIDYSKKILDRYPIIVRCNTCGLATEPCYSERNAIDTWNSMFNCKSVVGRQIKLF